MSLHAIRTDSSEQDDLCEAAIKAVNALALHMDHREPGSLQACRAFDLMADLIRLRRDCVSMARHREHMKNVTGGTSA